MLRELRKQIIIDPIALIFKNWRYSYFQAPASSGTVMFSSPQAEYSVGLPEERYEKTFPFCLPWNENGTGRREGRWLAG